MATLETEFIEDLSALVRCPRCLGCSNSRCLHNGAVMAQWKADHLKGRGLNKCNTWIPVKNPASLTFREMIIQEVKRGLKKSKDAIRSLQ